MLSEQQKQQLLSLARQSIEHKFNHPRPDFPPEPLFKKRLGVFVSLHKKGELRGCIGYIRAYKELGISIVEMAQAAAFRDPRFKPVKQDELPLIKLEISVLGDLIPIEDETSIQIGRDGLFIDHPHGSGLLLPQVAVEWKWDVLTFLAQVCSKAGLNKEAWRDQAAQLYRFEAEVFGED